MSLNHRDFVSGVRGPAIYFLLAGLLVATVLLAAGIGPYRIAPSDVAAAIMRYLIGAAGASPVYTVLFQIRLPRVMAAALVGAALAAAGAAYQSLSAIRSSRRIFSASRPARGWARCSAFCWDCRSPPSSFLVSAPEC